MIYNTGKTTLRRQWSALANQEMSAKESELFSQAICEHIILTMRNVIKICLNNNEYPVQNRAKAQEFYGTLDQIIHEFRRMGIKRVGNGIDEYNSKNNNSDDDDDDNNDTSGWATSSTTTTTITKNNNNNNSNNKNKNKSENRNAIETENGGEIEKEKDKDKNKEKEKEKETTKNKIKNKDKTKDKDREKEKEREREKGQEFSSQGESTKSKFWKSSRGGKTNNNNNLASCLSEHSRINSLKMCNDKGRIDIDYFIASQICEILASEKCINGLIKYPYYYNATKQSKYNIKCNIADGISCNISYFLEKSLLNQLSNCKEYIPNICDILRLSVRSTGISETLFNICGYHPFTVMDVGGLRAERRKWDLCITHSNILIFCVSLSDFDEYCLEDSDTNRLKESLNVWKYIIKKYWYSYLPIVLVFTKSDILYKKIEYAKQLAAQKLHMNMNMNSNNDENNQHNQNNENNENNDENKDNNNNNNSEQKKPGCGSFVYEYNPSKYFGIKMKNRFEPSLTRFEPSYSNNNNNNNNNTNSSNLDKSESKENSTVITTNTNLNTNNNSKDMCNIPESSEIEANKNENETDMERSEKELNIQDSNFLYTDNTMAVTTTPGQTGTPVTKRQQVLNEQRAAAASQNGNGNGYESESKSHSGLEDYVFLQHYSNNNNNNNGINNSNNNTQTIEESSVLNVPESRTNHLNVGQSHTQSQGASDILLSYSTLDIFDEMKHEILKLFVRHIPKRARGYKSETQRERAVTNSQNRLSTSMENSSTNQVHNNQNQNETQNKENNNNQTNNNTNNSNTNNQSNNNNSNQQSRISGKHNKIQDSRTDVKTDQHSGVDSPLIKSRKTNGTTAATNTAATATTATKQNDKSSKQRFGGFGKLNKNKNKNKNKNCNDSSSQLNQKNNQNNKNKNKNKNNYNNNINKKNSTYVDFLKNKIGNETKMSFIQNNIFIMNTLNQTDCQNMLELICQRYIVENDKTKFSSSSNNNNSYNNNNSSNNNNNNTSNSKKSKRKLRLSNNDRKNENVDCLDGGGGGNDDKNGNQANCARSGDSSPHYLSIFNHSATLLNRIQNNENDRNERNDRNDRNDKNRNVQSNNKENNESKICTKESPIKDDSERQKLLVNDE